MARPDSSNRYQVIEGLYQEAIDLPREARGGFLAVRCGDDDDLRNEVMALLRHFEAAPPDFLQSAAHDLDARLAGLQRPPQRIGAYEVVGVLGRGGMGTVYEAQQSQPSRRVALKVVRADGLDEGALRRFRHEAELLGQLEHPGIARLYEFGLGQVWHDGVPGHAQPYFAMELVRGSPLNAYVTDRRLDRTAAVELLIRVCAAVHHAHQKGIIHRDLKPSNVVVGDDGQPKVLDFGVARALQPATDTLTAQTAQGQLVGTLLYMSPEQLSGLALLADTRSDVYSLGVVAYEMLTGRLPFDIAGLPAPQAIRVLAERDPHPAGAHRRELRGDLEAILGKALRREPEHRYSSAAEFASDLRRYLRHEPILARPPTSIYRFRKFVRRHRMLVGAAALVAATGIGAAAWVTAAMLHAQRANLRATEMNDFLREILSTADPATGRADVRLVEVLRSAADQAAGRFANSPEFEAEIRNTLGLAFSNLSLYDEALIHVKRAHELLSATRGNHDPATLRAAGHLADLFKRVQQYDEAERWSSAVVARASRDSAVGLTARRTLALVRAAHGELTQAERELRDILKTARTVLGAHHHVTLGSTNDLALLLQMRVTRRVSPDRDADIREAVALFRSSLDAHVAAYGQEGFATLNLLTNFAQALVQAGELQEAAVVAEQILRDAPGRFGEDHRFCAAARTALIGVCYQQGRFAQAAAHAVATVESTRRLSNHENSVLVLSEMSDALHILDAGDALAEGESYSRTLVECFSAGSPAAHGGSLALRYRTYLARFISRQGRLDEAGELFAGILDAPNPDVDTQVFLEMAYGAHLALSGSLADAETRLLSAHMRMTERNVLVAATRQELVRLYQALGRADEAALWQARLAHGQ